MQKIEKLKYKIAQNKEFIENPNEFVYEALDYDIDDTELYEGLKMVLQHNIQLLKEIKQEINESNKIIKNTQSEEEKTEIKETTILDGKQNHESKTKRLSTHHLTAFEHFTDINEIDDYLEKNIEVKTKIKEIKLYLYGQILKLKKQIKEKILTNYLADVQELQNQIFKYQYFLEYLNEYENNKEEEKEQVKNKYNIIIVPDDKNSSYLNNDILSIKSLSKDIKIMMDKILSGYFMESKHTIPLVNYENLYEYKNSKNNLRFLFIVMGNNNIAICSVFYKDKLKSTKISRYYQDAVNRYKNQENKLKNNLNNPNFNIEQLELIGEIYSNLENSISLNLEKGDA